MKTFIETNHLFEIGDYQIIRKQMKEKHLRVKNITKDLGISRTWFYDQMYGRRYATWELFCWFKQHDIAIPYGEEIYGK